MYNEGPETEGPRAFALIRPVEHHNSAVCVLRVWMYMCMLLEGWCEIELGRCGVLEGSRGV